MHGIDTQSKKNSLYDLFQEVGDSWKVEECMEATGVKSERVLRTYASIFRTRLPENLKINLVFRDGYIIRRAF